MFRPPHVYMAYLAAGLAATSLAAVVTGANGRKFYPDDPISRIVDTQDASRAQEREIDLVYDTLENSLSRPGDTTPAMATGTEVVVTKLFWALGYHLPHSGSTSKVGVPSRSIGRGRSVPSRLTTPRGTPKSGKRGIPTRLSGRPEWTTSSGPRAESIISSTTCSKPSCALAGSTIRRRRRC